MKQIATIAIILLLSIGGWAQENEQEINQKVFNLENRVITLEAQQKLFDAAIAINKEKEKVDFDLKFNEIRKENRTVEIISSILLLLGVIAIATIIYQIFWGFRKEIDKKTLELQKQYEIKFKNLSDEAYSAFNESIKISKVEIKMKKDYRLNILYNGTEKDNHEKLFDMLRSFGFNCEVHEDINNLSLNEYDLLIFYDDTNNALMTLNEKGELVSTKKSKWLIEQLSKNEFINLKGTCGFFFINKDGLLHSFKEMNIDCFSSATTFATMYENLMSLLHYKRYLNDRNNL